MTAPEPMTPQERALRDALHAELLAPAAPDRLHLAVAKLAEREMAAGRRRWPWSRGTVGRGWQTGFALAAVVAVIAAAGFVVAGLGRRGDVAAPVPTLPPITQPSLPPAAAHPTTITDGAWVTPDVAWVMDGGTGVHITTDGGQTWSAARLLPSPDLIGLTFLDAAHGYAVGLAPDGAAVEVYRTTDGGTTWGQTSPGSLAVKGTTTSLDVHFSDASHGLVLAAAYTDGPAPSGGSATLVPVVCDGWVTSSGGASWTALANPPCASHVDWATPTTGIVVPTMANAGGVVATTLDGGLTWTRGTVPGIGDGTSLGHGVFVVAPGGALRLAVGVFNRDGLGMPGNLVVESSDGGASWHEAYRMGGTEVFLASTVTALTADHWITVIELGGDTRPYGPSFIEETADGGRSWTQTGALGTITARNWGWIDRLHGMVQGVDTGDCSGGTTPCGGAGTIFLTNDGGQTWHQVPF